MVRVPPRNLLIPICKAVARAKPVNSKNPQIHPQEHSACLCAMKLTRSATLSPERQAQSSGLRTGASRLLEIKQRMIALQQTLDEEQLAHSHKEEDFRKREDDLRRRDAEFEESLVSFSKYLQENDAKRARALKKAADERRLCEVKGTEAQKLAVEATLVKAELSEAQGIVARNMRHQQYLEAVIEQREAFQDIADVIARHQILAVTNEELRQQQQDAARDAERVRSEVQAHTKARVGEILVANAAIPRLKKEIEAAHQGTAAEDLRRLTAADKARKQALACKQVTLAAQYLSQRCVRQRRSAHGAPCGVQSQLKAVAHFVSDYIYINNTHRRS